MTAAPNMHAMPALVAGQIRSTSDRQIIHLPGFVPPPSRRFSAVGRGLVWLGEHPYVALATVVHIVMFVALYSLVMERREAEKPKKPIEIRISMEATPDTESEQEPDASSGAHNDMIVRPNTTPGTANDADAATNPGGMTAAPDPTDWKAPSETGKPQVRALQPMSGLNNTGDTGTVGGSGDTGAGTASGGYSGRNAVGRSVGIARYGGSGGSEAAVDAGLRWLAHHVHYADHVDSATDTVVRLAWWRPDEFPSDARDLDTGRDITYPNARAEGEVGKQEYEVGVTGLCGLTFLGAGHTPSSSEYGDLVAGLINWMMRQQDRYGRLGRNNMYNHAIGTLFLSEALNMTRDDALRPTVKRAVEAMINAQYAHGGWDYEHRASGPRNDSSITSWCLMALKSAHAAGIEIPRMVFIRIIHHFRRMMTADGYTIYADRRKSDYRLGAALVGTSLFCRRILGAPQDDPMLQRQADIVIANLPDPSRLTMNSAEGLDSSYYTWYIGTLAMFFTGGEYWNRWNSTMRETAISQQRRVGHLRGSWDGKDRWSWAGGRLYATAMMVLSLEIYYRYVPQYFLADARSLEPFHNPHRLYAALGEELRDAPVLSKMESE